MVEAIDLDKCADDVQQLCLRGNESEAEWLICNLDYKSGVQLTVKLLCRVLKFVDAQEEIGKV